MSTFATNFSVDHFRAESAREQEQLQQQQVQPPKLLSNEAQVLAKSIAHHGVPVAAARVLVAYLDALEQRVQALEEAARNSKPAHLRKVEARTA